MSTTLERAVRAPWRVPEPNEVAPFWQADSAASYDAARRYRERAEMLERSGDDEGRALYLRVASGEQRRAARLAAEAHRLASVPVLEPHCGSWVAIDRETGKPTLETFDRLTAERIDPERFEVVTAAEWLVRFNRAVSRGEV